MLSMLALFLWMPTGCSNGDPAGESADNTTSTAEITSAAVDEPAEPSTTSTSTTAPEPVANTTPRPDWLGVRTVPTSPDGRGQAVETPPELRDRRFATVDTLPEPVDEVFRSTNELLADRPDVLARSTWVEGCPVGPDDLAYLTVMFWGFDDQPHTGELIVAATEADKIVTVFEAIFEARFPIEEMRVVTLADLDAPPTGDGNNTTGFVCRPVTGGSAFSEHAKGLAIDINPFHNPYEKGEVVLPEQATYYLNRTLSGSPGSYTGVVVEGDAVHQAFIGIGWEWGGAWRSLKDYQHFSATGK